MTTAFRPVPGALLRNRLVEIVHRVLSGRDGFPELSRSRCASLSFAALGVDSLAGAELTLEIEEELGFALSPADIFAYPDVESLAQIIERRESPGGPYSAAPPSAARRHRLARMLDDATLPTNIRPIGRTRASTILVTGATGFVGAHLVRALLRDPGARVRCLVRDRAGDVREATARVRSALERYAPWDSSFATRLEVAVGDLTRPSLGLDETAFADLAGSTGAIFHAAADVDWIQPYEALREANVVGTRELLRLACTGEAKPFHFISSLGVCYDTDWRDAGAETDEPLATLPGLHLGYAQSKCVAEALVYEAGRRGLPVTIVRPALVSGDSQSGVSNADDLVSLFMRGCIRMGAAPDLDWAMDSVPADHRAFITSRTHPRDTGVSACSGCGCAGTRWSWCPIARGRTGCAPTRRLRITRSIHCAPSFSALSKGSEGFRFPSSMKSTGVAR
jgi:nucleoside-diphosphate-sugar epimerase/acyl carrier protein